MKPRLNVFVVEGLKHLYEIGTVVPSSRWLARAMAYYLNGNGRNGNTSPKRVLEVGPGTGAVTKTILSSLNAGDEFYLVEINPAFCRHLERRLLRRYRTANPEISVELRCESILTSVLPGKMDLVICTLPFRAFAPNDVRRILDRLSGLLTEDGRLTYMQYAGVRYLKYPFVRRSRRGELRRIDAICRSRARRYDSSRQFVPLNILPSFVTRWAKPG